MTVTAGPQPSRRGVPQFVVAQVAGVLGGLAVGLDQLVAPPRPKICDKAVTRC